MISSNLIGIGDLESFNVIPTRIYIAQLYRPGTWIGEHELNVCANILDRRIEVY